MRTNLRKCAVCEKDIDLAKDKSFIIFKKRYLHGDCFIQRQTSLKKKGAAWTQEQCEEEIQRFQAEFKKDLERRVAEETLIQFLSEQYDISFFPSYFYIKLKSVYDGTYKGLHSQVPPEHLLEMWQTKMTYLNRVNAKKAEPLSGINRIYYDMAILLSRYDKFLEWKKAQQEELDAIKKDVANKRTQVDYSVIQNERKEDKKTNLNDILDEI